MPHPFILSSHTPTSLHVKFLPETRTTFTALAPIYHPLSPHHPNSASYSLHSHPANKPYAQTAHSSSQSCTSHEAYPQADLSSLLYIRFRSRGIFDLLRQRLWMFRLWEWWDGIREFLRLERVRFIDGKNEELGRRRDGGRQINGKDNELFGSTQISNLIGVKISSNPSSSRSPPFNGPFPDGSEYFPRNICQHYLLWLPSEEISPWDHKEEVRTEVATWKVRERKFAYFHRFGFILNDLHHHSHAILHLLFCLL